MKSSRLTRFGIAHPKSTHGCVGSAGLAPASFPSNVKNVELRASERILMPKGVTLTRDSYLKNRRHPDLAARRIRVKQDINVIDTPQIRGCHNFIRFTFGSYLAFIEQDHSV